MTADDVTQRLADMRDRSEKATPGPWGTYAAYGSRGVEVTDSENMVFIQDGGITYAVHEADAEFIAHARTDLDDLRGAVEDVLVLAAAAEQSGHRPSPMVIRDAITARLGGA